MRKRSLLAFNSIATDGLEAKVSPFELTDRLNDLKVSQVTFTKLSNISDSKT